MSGEAEAEQCGLIDPACHLGNIVEGAGEAVAHSGLKAFADAMYQFALWILQVITTWWLETPTAGVNSSAVQSLQSDLHWYVAGFAFIGFFMGLIRMITTQDIRVGLQTSFKPIVNLILVTGLYSIGVVSLLQAGDEGAVWLMERTANRDANLSAMFMPAAAGQNAQGGVAMMLLIYLVAGIGGIVNFVFMIFRSILLVVLMALLPAIAAATGTQRGDQAFAKANGWLIALLLFKPVAAAIYALGFRMMQNSVPDSSFEEAAQSAVDQLIGAGIIAIAALALPALIKFLVPAAATGEAAFSGGAAVGAAAGAAAGAAVLAGTGGAGAAAGASGSTGAASAAKGMSSGGSGSGAASSSGSGSTASGSGSSGSSGGSSGGSGESSSSGSAAGGGSSGGEGGSMESSISGSDTPSGNAASGSGSGSGGSGGSEQAADKSGGGTGQRLSDAADLARGMTAGGARASEAVDDGEEGTA